MIKYHIDLQETFLDYPDPEGSAVILFMSGCIHCCPGCQNPELQQSVKYDETKESLCNRIVEFSKRSDTNKLVLSGGDPLAPKNIEYTKYILETLGISFDICIYTGYSYSDIKKFGLAGYKYIKCGKFDILHKQNSFKTDEMIQFASPNQELYEFGNDTPLTTNGVFYFNNKEGVTNE